MSAEERRLELEKKKAKLAEMRNQKKRKQEEEKRKLLSNDAPNAMNRDAKPWLRSSVLDVSAWMKKADDLLLDITDLVSYNDPKDPLSAHFPHTIDAVTKDLNDLGFRDAVQFCESFPHKFLIDSTSGVISLKPDERKKYFAQLKQQKANAKKEKKIQALNETLRQTLPELKTKQEVNKPKPNIDDESLALLATYNPVPPSLRTAVRKEEALPVVAPKKTECIHFKFAHEGKTRRFAFPGDNHNFLFGAVRDRVKTITAASSVLLYWRDDESLIVLECGDDMQAAIDFAESTMKPPACVTIEATVEKEEENVEQVVPQEEVEAEVVAPKVVSRDESMSAFNDFAFMCDACDCYLSPANGGRYKCMICDNYDLCAECVAKGVHDNHALVRLLSGDTLVPLAVEGGTKNVQLKEISRCTPSFVAKPANSAECSTPKLKLCRTPKSSPSAIDNLSGRVLGVWFNHEQEKNKKETNETAKTEKCKEVSINMEEPRPLAGYIWQGFEPSERNELAYEDSVAWEVFEKEKRIQEKIKAEAEACLKELSIAEAEAEGNNEELMRETERLLKEMEEKMAEDVETRVKAAKKRVVEKELDKITEELKAIDEKKRQAGLLKRGQENRQRQCAIQMDDDEDEIMQAMIARKFYPNVAPSSVKVEFSESESDSFDYYSSYDDSTYSDELDEIFNEDMVQPRAAARYVNADAVQAPIADDAKQSAAPTDSETLSALFVDPTDERTRQEAAMKKFLEDRKRFPELLYRIPGALERQLIEEIITSCRPDQYLGQLDRLAIIVAAKERVKLDTKMFTDDKKADEQTLCIMAAELSEQLRILHDNVTFVLPEVRDEIMRLRVVELSKLKENVDSDAARRLASLVEKVRPILIGDYDYAQLEEYDEYPDPQPDRGFELHRRQLQRRIEAPPQATQPSGRILQREEVEDLPPILERILLSEMQKRFPKFDLFRAELQSLVTVVSENARREHDTCIFTTNKEVEKEMIRQIALDLAKRLSTIWYHVFCSCHEIGRKTVASRLAELERQQGADKEERRYYAQFVEKLRPILCSPYQPKPVEDLRLRQQVAVSVLDDVLSSKIDEMIATSRELLNKRPSESSKVSSDGSDIEIIDMLVEESNSMLDSMKSLDEKFSQLKLQQSAAEDGAAAALKALQEEAQKKVFADDQLESLDSTNTLPKDNESDLELKRYQDWILSGAKETATVHNSTTSEESALQAVYDAFSLVSSEGGPSTVVPVAGLVVFDDEPRRLGGNNKNEYIERAVEPENDELEKELLQRSEMEVREQETMHIPAFMEYNILLELHDMENSEDIPTRLEHYCTHACKNSKEHKVFPNSLFSQNRNVEKEVIKRIGTDLAKRLQTMRKIVDHTQSSARKVMILNRICELRAQIKQYEYDEVYFEAVCNDLHSILLTNEYTISYNPFESMERGWKFVTGKAKDFVENTKISAPSLEKLLRPHNPQQPTISEAAKPTVDNLQFILSGKFAHLSKPIKSWSVPESKLNRQLVDTCIDKCKFRSVRPIQAITIPAIMAGHDLWIQSPHGVGNATAFLLPLLNEIIAARRPIGPGQIELVVVASTVEKVYKLAEQAHRITQRIPSIHIVCSVGQTSYAKTVSELVSTGTHVLITTPGRLREHVHREHIHLESARYSVVYGADRLLEDHQSMTEVEWVLGAWAGNQGIKRNDRQNLMFSTSSSPALDELAQKILNENFHRIRPSNDPEVVKTTQQQQQQQDEQRMQEEEDFRSKAGLSTATTWDPWEQEFPALPSAAAFPPTVVERPESLYSLIPVPDQPPVEPPVDYNEPWNATAEAESNVELDEKQKDLLAQLFETGIFEDYDRMVMACRIAHNLDQAIELMLVEN